MIIIHVTNKELYLAYFSVKKYLLEQNYFKITTSSISITKTCLTYLTDINGSYKEIKRDFPMARYAAEVWIGYTTLAQASEDIVRVTVRLHEILIPDFLLSFVVGHFLSNSNSTNSY